jgi:hypothetical protein
LDGIRVRLVGFSYDFVAYNNNMSARLRFGCFWDKTRAVDYVTYFPV